MSERPWEFWIDVGGTFTDCLATVPDGTVHRHKLLSSGVTKGRVGADSTSEIIVDDTRRNDPPAFWTGWQLSIVDDEGRETVTSTVSDFDHRKRPLASSRPAPRSRHRRHLRTTLRFGRPHHRHSLPARLTALSTHPAHRPPARHHARHQRAHHPHRRPYRARHDPRLWRRPGNRLPSPTAIVRPRHPQTAAAHRGRRRNRRASHPRRPGARSHRQNPPSANNCSRSTTPASSRLRFACCMPTAIRPTSKSSPASPAKSAFAKSAPRMKWRRCQKSSPAPTRPSSTPT